MAVTLSKYKLTARYSEKLVLKDGIFSVKLISTFSLYMFSFDGVFLAAVVERLSRERVERRVAVACYSIVSKCRLF